jgi:hypothetical protein
VSTGQKGEIFNSTLHHVVERYLPLRRGNPEDVRKDVLSHFILRLAFCSTQQVSSQNTPLTRAGAHQHHLFVAGAELVHQQRSSAAQVSPHQRG